MIGSRNTANFGLGLRAKFSAGDPEFAIPEAKNPCDFFMILEKKVRAFFVNSFAKLNFFTKTPFLLPLFSHKISVPFPQPKNPKRIIGGAESIERCERSGE